MRSEVPVGGVNTLAGCSDAAPAVHRSSSAAPSMATDPVSGNQGRGPRTDRPARPLLILVPLPSKKSVSYTHLTLPTIYSV